MRRVIAFDVIGTLFSLGRVGEVLRDLGVPEQAAELWLASSLRDYVGISHAGGYAALRRVLRADLPFVLDGFGASPDAGDVERVLEALGELEPREGAYEACALLGEAGAQVVALTNGSEDATRALLDRSHLAEVVERVFSCDVLGTSKPHPDVYRWAAHETDADSLWLVSCHPWDVQGARRAGFRSVWVTDGARPFPLEPGPDWSAESLTAVAERLARQPERV